MNHVMSSDDASCSDLPISTATPSTETKTVWFSGKLLRIFKLESGVFPTAGTPVKICQNHMVFPEVPAVGPSNGSISLFCFAWTPRRKFDEQLLSEVRIQLQSCRDEIFRWVKTVSRRWTVSHCVTISIKVEAFECHPGLVSAMDMSSTQIPVVLVQRSFDRQDDRRHMGGGGPVGAQEPDFVRVSLPTQKVSRDQGGWLYHRCEVTHRIRNITPFNSDVNFHQDKNWHYNDIINWVCFTPFLT